MRYLILFIILIFIIIGLKGSCLPIKVYNIKENSENNVILINIK